MGAAVAHRAIGRALVSGFARQPVHSAGIIARLVLVASGADWFGNARGVRIFLVRFVAGIAGEAGVGALRQFLRLVVTSSAIGLGRSRRLRAEARAGGRQQESELKRGTEPRADGEKCPVPHAG